MSIKIAVTELGTQVDRVAIKFGNVTPPPLPASWTVKVPISVNVGVFQPGLVVGPTEAQYVTALGGNSARVGIYCDNFFNSAQTTWPSGAADDNRTKQSLAEALAQGIRPVLVCTVHSTAATQDREGNVPMDKLLALLLSPALYKGKIDVELSNEPDVGAGPHWDPTALANYYVHHYPRIKALDPACKVIGPAFDGCTGVSGGTLAAPIFGNPGMSYVNAFMAIAKNSVDIISYHHYYQLSPEYRYKVSRVWQAAYPTKELCITEIGWHLSRAQGFVPNEAQGGCNNDQQIHADRTSRDVLLQSCVPSMRYVQVYRARDTSVFWVFNATGGNTPTSLALADIFPAMRDSTKRRLYQIGADILHAAMVVCFDFANGTQKLVAWNSSNSAATLPVWVTGSAPVAMKVAGGAGSSLSFTGGQGLITVPIGARPLILSNARFPEYS